MSEQRIPGTTVTEEELHAYVDGVLADPRRSEVEHLLESNEALAAKVSDYYSLNNMLHQRYDRVLGEPVPPHLRLPARRQRAMNWPHYAGMAAALVLGIGIGTASNFGRQSAPPMSGTTAERTVAADGSEWFARQSAIAHVMYAPEVQRPVEIGADRERELVQWLSSRLGTNMQPPVLTRTGFELMGGRLLPGDDGPVAQFMYHDASGERVTLCISRRKPPMQTTAFKLYRDGPVNVFYWIDGDFGYAISGGIDRKVLLELAHDVHRQLDEQRTPGGSHAGHG